MFTLRVFFFIFLIAQLAVAQVTVIKGNGVTIESYADFNSGIGAADNNSIIKLEGNDNAAAGNSIVINALTIQSDIDGTVRTISDRTSSLINFTTTADKDKTLTIKDILFENNKNVISASEATNINLLVSNVSFIGGERAIDANTSNVTLGLSDSSFTGQNTAGPGGSIFVYALTMSGSNNTFSGNNVTGATIYGGAIYVSKIFDLTGSGNLFTGNSSASNGGAIRAETLNLGGSYNTFTGNTANGGGALLLTDLYVTGDNISFTNNTVTSSGGAVTSTNVDFKTGSNNILFANNTAKNGAGGAISVITALNLAGSNITFSNNSAKTTGGAINVRGVSTIAGSNITFSDNKAEGAGGGAIYSTNIVNLSGSNIYFTGNKATTGNGGAIYTLGNLNISGNNISFSGNIANGVANSIHFDTATAKTFTVSSTGDLLMYDPITKTGAGLLTINKTGTGLWTLGGNNNSDNTAWNINAGTLLLTYDSLGDTAQINSTNDFTLGAGGTLLVVPDQKGNTIEINAATITMTGNVGLGSDTRHVPKINMTGDLVVLRLSDGSANTSNIATTDGIFSLGLYDYEYDNLRWGNGDTDLIMHIKSGYANQGRSGGHSMLAPMASALYNPINHLLFGRITDIFDMDEKNGNDTWGYSYFNFTSGGKNSYDISGPGIAAGIDKTIGANAFAGISLSETWHDFEQNQTTVTGNEMRMNAYGGAEYNGWEFGAFTGLGFSKHNHKRTDSADTYKADYKGYNVSIGTSVAKTIDYAPKGVAITPFLNYELIHVSTDKFTEKGAGLASLSATAHTENISRTRLGAEGLYALSKGNVSGSVFWQSQFGDTAPKSTSWLNSAPTDRVRAQGSEIIKNSIGLDFGWSNKFSENMIVKLTYSGLFSPDSISTEFGFVFNYKF